MHVLRAEKGYPIIGQDTDGTVTPQDLGMGWVVSKKKPDFIGKRSFARADEPAPATASSWSACCRSTADALLPEGAQIVELRRDAARAAGARCSATSPPATAAPRSAGPFALALVKGGRERIGETLYVARRRTRWWPVTVTGPVLFDPEGARRDG